MSVQQALRSATEEDLLEMGLEELHTLAQLSTQAVVQGCENEVSTMEQERQTLPEHEPRVLECFASSPVKLNVGGTYFSTSIENLTREPGTFFSVMLSGKWEVNPKDDAVFVDRSPFVFKVIVDYMRKRTIDLEDLNPQQLNALLKEADFYQIASLLELLRKPAFSPQIKGKVQGNSRATRVGRSAGWAYATSLAAFSPSVRGIKVRLIKGMNVLIGVAPESILEGKTFTNCGWHVHAHNGCLYSQSGDSGKLFRGKIKEGSVVRVKLDEAFNIFFQVDGEDWGVAYSGVAQDYSVPLHLSVGLYQPGDAVELV